MHRPSAPTPPNSANPRRSFGERATSALGLFAVLALFNACSSVPAPREEIAVGRASVERASGPAAAEAPVELAAARDKMERANIALANKDYVLARQLAQQADADAALAEAQSRAVRSGRALTEVRASIEQLRSELSKRPTAP